MLSILFITTHRCNLRCAYCYEPISNEWPDMTIEDAFSAFKWIANLAEIRKDYEILFMWFGGEPFSVGIPKMGVFLQIQQKVFGHSAIKIRNVVQTNMTIWDDDIVPMLKRYFNNSISVSLDFNPRLRVYPNGKPTQGDVLENVSKLKEAGVSIGFIGTLTSADIGHEKEAYAFYKALNCPFRLNRGHGTVRAEKNAVAFMSVGEFDEFIINMFQILVDDAPPRALFLNYYDAINSLRNKVSSDCRLLPENGINFAIEPCGIISDWCRFGGKLASYREPNSFFNFNVQGWCDECPSACADCSYYNIVCKGACEYEKGKSCEESNCGFRTERTRRQLDFVRRYLDSLGVRHCLTPGTTDSLSQKESLSL